MAIRSIIVLSLLALVAGDTRTACENKAAGDPCEYVTTLTTECSVVDGEKFCRKVTVAEHSVWSECSIHSRQGYLGCFSNAQEDPVFKVCVGETAGSICVYETPASTKGHYKGPAFNTTANCISHYSHGILMCLESVGQPDDEECEGKGVGHPCTDPDSPNAVCAHHSRRGNWMCLAPATESMVFVVCQGRDAGTACSYTGSGQHGGDSGLIQGECCPHESSGVTTHGQMMCHQLEDIGGSCLDEVAKDEDSFPWTLVLVIAGSGLVIIILSVGILCLRSQKSKARAPAAATVVVGLPCGESEGNDKMQTV